MGSSPFLPLPSTLGIDSVEQHSQTVVVHLSATSPTAPCPRCETPGSRVHSRYLRTIADLPCVGQRLVLKLLVRKWVCPASSCSQRIFAERFPGLVQSYARMTDRLKEALQSVGITTNGADGARLFARLSMPTTGKTIIRRVIGLPLPADTSVRVAGIDEWAWKKGSHYGTILVDLEQRRVAALLPERSEETAAAWFATHPEVRWIARDRGKIFRDAATRGAPQAQQVADRFHLQQNLAEALKGFFQRNAHVLKITTRSLSGQTLPVPTSPKARQTDQASQHYHATRIMRHQLVWELFHAGHPKEEIARLVGISSRSVYRVLSQEQPPARLRRHHTRHLVDPYISYLARRWNEGCKTPAQLYEEVVAQGYTGSKRSLQRVLHQFGTLKGQPITRQTATLAKILSARSAALSFVRAPGSQTKDQKAFIEQVCQVDPTVAAVYQLAQDFGQLLRKREGKSRLEHWKVAVYASGVKELTSFADGLADDAVAIANACTEAWSNGMVEGFNHKLKWIKRSSYGQAGFPLLQRRVLLHPAAQKPVDKEQRPASAVPEGAGGAGSEASAVAA
jgi:transposase